MPQNGIVHFDDAPVFYQNLESSNGFDAEWAERIDVEFWELLDMDALGIPHAIDGPPGLADAIVGFPMTSIVEVQPCYFNAARRALIHRNNGANLVIAETDATLRMMQQIILHGPPGTGKTLQAKRLAALIVTGRVLDAGQVDRDEDFIRRQGIPGEGEVIEGGRWDIVQFHPSYNYDDFVQGIRAKTTLAGQVAYEVTPGPLLRMANLARENGKEKFVLIIDEINRANVAAVLGELIYALEYRGQAVTLGYGERNAAIVIPQNLFIIGTMNTADRSIGHIDYAVRRRFAFVPLIPDGYVVERAYQKDQDTLRKRALNAFEQVAALFSAANAQLTADYKPSDVQPGHSYFLAADDAALTCKLKYQVVPLLREYVADGVLKQAANAKIDAIGEL